MTEVRTAPALLGGATALAGGSQTLNNQPVVTPPPVTSRPQTRGVWRIFLRNRGAVASAAILLVLACLAVFAPLLAPYNPTAQDGAAAFQGPGGSHLLGTDSLGRDLLSRTMFGARISLSIGLLAVLLSMLVGLPLGLISGYQGGSVEDVVMRGMDILLAMPSIILAIAIVAAVGPSLAGVVVAIAISSIPGIVRLARAQTLAVKRLEYVEAARALGAGSRRIMLRHILPNVIGTLVVQATLNVGFAILVEAGLSFLGLGVQPPTPTWGGMVSEGRKYIFTAAYIGIVPGVFIMFASLACNLVGDSLRDALDPRSKLRTGG